MDAEPDPLLSEEKQAHWSRTNASIEWVKCSEEFFEFPDEIEKVLEEDFFQNPSLYTKKVLGCLGMVSLIHNETNFPSPEEILNLVRAFHSIENSA